jgi:hypothetical protein
MSNWRSLGARERATQMFNVGALTQEELDYVEKCCDEGNSEECEDFLQRAERYYDSSF